jgi:hypothetical protein
VRQVQSWSEALTHGAGTVTDIVLAASFVPFLAYFLLTWQSHARSATVMLFPLHHRNTAFVTLGLIGKMLQSFIVGNLLIGLLISAISVGDFRLAACSVFLLRRLSQRLSEPGSLPGNCAGDGSANPGRLGQLEPGDLVIVVVCVGWPASFRAECSLSEAAGEPPEDQSAGGHDRAAVLGSGLGRDSDWCSPIRSRAPSRLS